MLTKSNVSSFSLVPVLFVLTLFLLLSALSISVILAGSTVYEKIAGDMENNYDRRVPFAFLTTKIRQNDKGGNISIEEKDGVKMIAISENDGFVVNTTYIYYYEGYIWENYTFSFIDMDDMTFDWEFDWGEKIIEITAKDFDFDFQNDGKKIELFLKETDGKVNSTTIFLRSSK